MDTQDTKTQMLAAIHITKSESQRIDARLRYLITNHAGYVAVSIEELEEVRNILELTTSIMDTQALALAGFEDGLDVMLEEMGVDPNSLEGL